MKHLGDVVHETAVRLEGVLGTFALPYTERIFEHLLGCSRSGLYTSKNGLLDASLLEQHESMVRRCLNHEPLDYILGVSYFFDREFVVSPAVLIPRPDTETLIELVLQREDNGPRFFADVGTGSGIIAAVLTEHRAAWSAVATDISPEAIAVARVNRRSERMHLVCCDLLETVSARTKFDFIVSNPPYIKTGDIAGLDESVRGFEPRQALDGGSDGLDFYRAIAKEAPRHLKAGGRMYCEIGHDQEDGVKLLFVNGTWDRSQVIRDLGGHPRVFFTNYTGLRAHD